MYIYCKNCNWFFNICIIGLFRNCLGCVIEFRCYIVKIIILLKFIWGFI